jgi:hypothetical protein
MLLCLLHASRLASRCACPPPLSLAAGARAHASMVLVPGRGRGHFLGNAAELLYPLHHLVVPRVLLAVVQALEVILADRAALWHGVVGRALRAPHANETRSQSTRVSRQSVPSRRAARPARAPCSARRRSAPPVSRHACQSRRTLRPCRCAAHARPHSSTPGTHHAVREVEEEGVAAALRAAQPEPGRHPTKRRLGPPSSHSRRRRPHTTRAAFASTAESSRQQTKWLGLVSLGSLIR